MKAMLTMSHWRCWRQRWWRWRQRRQRRWWWRLFSGAEGSFKWSFCDVPECNLLAQKGLMTSFPLEFFASSSSSFASSSFASLALFWVDVLLFFIHSLDLLSFPHQTPFIFLSALFCPLIKSYSRLYVTFSKYLSSGPSVDPCIPHSRDQLLVLLIDWHIYSNGIVCNDDRVHCPLRLDLCESAFQTQKPAPRGWPVGP